MKPTVAVIIVTWNSEKDIEVCLESLQQQEYEGEIKTIVVDNASHDKTVSLVKSHFPEVDVQALSKNTYFTGGNNYGITYALEIYNPDYLLILNPDTKASPNLISEMVAVAESDQKIGIVGPKVLFWNNQHEGKINSAGMIYDGFMQAYDRGFEEEDTGQYDVAFEEVPAVTGTCMLIKKEVAQQTGGFWKPLKMYLEDVELCIRAKKLGWKIVYTANTSIEHSWMQSTSKNKQVKVDRWKRRNWLLIAMRHYSLRSKIAMLKHYLTS